MIYPQANQQENYQDYKSLIKYWLLQYMSKKGKSTYSQSKKTDTSIAPNYNNEKPHPLVAYIWEKLDQEFYKLKKIYTNWLFHHGQYKSPYQIDVIKKYLLYYHQFTENDQFRSSNRGILTIKRQDLSNSPSEDIIFKSFGILNGTAWAIRMTNKFIQRLSQHQQSGAKNILAIMMFLADGNFPGTNYKDSFMRIKPLNYNQSFDYTSYFSLRIFLNKNVIFNVGVERIPIMDRHERITRYQFKPYMNFIDIINDNKMVTDINEILTQYSQKLNDDVARGRDVVDDLTPILPKYKNMNQNFNLFTFQSIGMMGQSLVVRTDLATTDCRRYNAPQFQPVYLSNAQSSSLVFDQEMHRWLSSDAKMRIQRKKFNLFQQTVNRQMLRKYVDFQSAKNLVDLLQKIPNFRITLTEEEKNVIGQNGNVMVIGRSGTGKTTCAVMRLFAIQMLFRIRVSLNKKKFQSLIEDTKFMADDIDETLGLHSLFVTASPVLTNEIQRYYKKLTDQIKQQLQKKKKRLQEKKKVEQQLEKDRKIQESQEGSINQSKYEVIEKEKKEQVSKSQQQIEEIEQIKDQIPSIEKQLSAQEKENIEEEQHITQHFEGISLENKPQVEEQDSDQFDQEFEQLEQKINKFASLNDLQQHDYPGFFTVRALIMMIDGTLKKPFFLRTNDNKIMGKESKAAWHNEEKGVMMIQNYYKKMQVQDEQDIKPEDVNQEELVYSDEEELQHQYQRQLRLREQRNRQQFKQRIQRQKTRNRMSFEVDYDYFAVHFWPQIKRRYYTDKNISAHMIWTEIYSSIKGSANSHLYPGGYIPQKVYLEKCQNMFLTTNQKRQIFQSFCQYERWKSKMYAYDLIDVVNYINTQLRWSGYYGPSIHYLMIDQVQDLPHSILYLLTRVAQQGVFFSGDTAQTIAKGVGFRFGDLKSMFDQKHFDSDIKLQKPSVLQLTVNFRSHNNILQLANSIVSIIEVLFPKTIDRLKKQRSNLHGPKPMLLADADQQLLFLVLSGEQFYKKQLQSTTGDLMKRPPLEFGCDQVIIVRDQQSKKKIPPLLQHALCLTIYEAKGLQFNDVILFNFFTDSKCQDRWGLFKFINVIEEEVDREEYEKSLTKHPHAEENSKPKQEKKEQKKEQKNQQKKEQQKEQKKEEDFGETQLLETIQKGNKIITKKIKPMSNINIKDINDYGELCSELKLLYTAVTRPRNTLIIYDEDSSSRKVVQKFWQKVGVTQTITKQVLETVKDKGQNKKSEEAQIFQSLISKTDPSEWKKQGLRMFKRKYFEQAMKCFERSGDRELYVKAEANNLANQATKNLIEIQADKGYLKDKLYAFANLSRIQTANAKARLKSNQRAAISNFLRAGKLFEELKMWKQAGQCFFSGKDFKSAINNFKLTGMDKQIGQSLFMLEKYKQASQYFDKAQDYLKTIECFDLLNDWAGILKSISKYSSKIPEIEKQTLIRKYAALSLEQLVKNIQFENQDHKQEEMKKQAVQPLIIHQKSEDQQQDSEEQYDQQEEDSDPEAEAQKEYNKKMSAELSKKASEEILSDEILSEKRRKQSEISQGMQSIGRKESNVSNSSQIQQKKQQSQKLPSQKSKLPLNKSEGVQNDSSIQIIQDGEDSSFFKLNNPSDASHSNNSSWIQLNEPDIQKIKSIVDPADEWLKSAFSDIQNKSHTDYSVIDEDQKIAKNARIIKTKGNIFIQDNVMQKIIDIVSIVNVNIENYLSKLRGHESLTTTKKQGIEHIQIGDFEEIEPEFIFKILDTLESFKIYKLCVFVCNRYHMPSKLGRYIASMMLRYSITSQENMTITPSLLAPGSHRKALLEKGILSSIALHSILENINPVFLKIKIDSKNTQTSLGTYFVIALILQGLYKKVVFMVDLQQALAVLYNYFESETYRSLYVNNFLKVENAQNFLYLPQKPSDKGAIEYTIFMTESLIWKKLYKVSSKENNHPLVSSYFSKEHSLRSLHFNTQFPDYLPFNKTLWKYIEKKQSLEHLLVKLRQFKPKLEGLLSGSKEFQEIQVYDLITFAIVILNSEQIINIYGALPYEQVVAMHSNFKKLYTFISNLRSYSRYRASILKAFLSVYQARILSSKAKTMAIFGDSFVFIHRSSSIVSDLVEYRRKKLIQFQQKVAKLVDHNLKFRQQIFFCEQNLDILMAPLTIILENISQRILKRIIDSLLKFSATLYETYDEVVFLHEDLILLQQKYILFSYCKHQSEKLNLVYERFRPKTKTVNKQIRPAKYTNNREKKHAPKITRSLVSHQVQELQDSDQQETNFKDGRLGFLYQNVFNHHPKLHPQLQNFLLQRFNSSKSRKINFSKFLYVSGQNKLFRQFCRRLKGFMLYDALQFKLFNRVDLYASNLFDSLNDMAFVDQVYYLKDCLVKLIVHLNSLNNKVFKVQLPTSLLKHVEGIKFQEYVNSQVKNPDFRDAISNNIQCIFSADYKCSSDEDYQGILQLIIQCLRVIMDRIQDKHIGNIVEIKQLFTAIILNVPINQKINQDIQCIIRKVKPKSRSILGRIQGFSLGKITEETKKPCADQDRDNVIIHEIKFCNKADHELNVQNSQNDYNNYEAVLGKRIRATRTIQKHLKKIFKTKEPFIQPTPASRRIKQYNRFLCNWVTVLYDVQPNFQFQLLKTSSQLTSDLLQFFMQHAISSALDLHFMLMTMMRINELRNELIAMGRDQQVQQIGQEQAIEKIRAQLNSITNEILNWKADQKWLIKNANLKKKKVFEIKWLSKTHEMKVVKKRQGLKKQALLQEKKVLSKLKK